MFGKYSEKAIKKINERLGAGHRVKPYDMTDPDDLKQALLTAVAAYRDYNHYREALIGLEENYDESLEYCDTTAWLDMETAPGRVDSLTADGYASLYAAADVFEKLTERARENCVKIIKTVLSETPETQNHVFGCVYDIEPKDMDARISELFEMLEETEYHQSMPDNLEAVLKLMYEHWPRG